MKRGGKLTSVNHQIGSSSRHGGEGDGKELDKTENKMKEEEPRYKGRSVEGKGRESRPSSARSYWSSPSQGNSFFISSSLHLLPSLSLYLSLDFSYVEYQTLKVTLETTKFEGCVRWLNFKQAP